MKDATPNVDVLDKTPNVDSVDVANKLNEKKTTAAATVEPTTTTSEPTTTTSEPTTTTETTAAEGFDVLGTERTLQKGKNANSISVNSNVRNSDSINAYDGSSSFSNLFSSF